MCDLPDWRDWREWVVPVHLKYRDDGDVPGEQYYPCIRLPENEEPKMSPEEEYLLMKKQVEDSEGFDIDFAQFRCVFNYRPLDFDDYIFSYQTETTREFMDRLSRESLKGFNKKYGTEYEFVKAIKANYHFSAGLVYFITFEGKLLSDDKPKQFRAKLSCRNDSVDYISCELKPEKNVHSIEAMEKQDPKKPRLTQEASNV